jgi:hypothetical protein
MNWWFLGSENHALKVTVQQYVYADTSARAVNLTTFTNSETKRRRSRLVFRTPPPYSLSSSRLCVRRPRVVLDRPFNAGRGLFEIVKVHRGMEFHMGIKGKKPRFCQHRNL